MSDKRRNSLGVMWSAIERFAIQGAQFVVSMIIARLLLPADYGLIAMLTIFIAIATSLIDSGMAQAIIQRQNRSESDLSTALIFNIAAAIGLYLCIYVSAPYIAQFYNSPELCPIARVYSITLIINSLSVVQQALITIAIDFKRQAIASLSGITVGGTVAIIMAYSGYGVWALVMQQIVNSIVFSSLLWIMSSWSPSSGFSWSSFKVLSRFGSKLMVAGLMHTIYTNMYTLVIGKCFSPSSLGLFNRAAKIMVLPSVNVTVVVGRVLYPILCKVQDSTEEAATTLLRYMRVVCFIVFPMMIGIALVAKPLTLILLGEQWLEMVKFLQIIAVAYMWDPVMGLCVHFVRSQGRSGDILRAETIKKICGVAILFASLPFGIDAMCYGLILYALCDMAIIIFFTRKISPTLGYINITKEILPTVLITALMGAVVWYISQYTEPLPSSIEIVVASIIGCVVVFGVASATKRPELRQIIEIIKELRTKE